jgi:hypothetical protein
MRVPALISATLFFAAAACTVYAGSEMAAGITLNRATHFTASDGSDIQISPGKYQVEQSGESGLRLTKEDMKSIEIQAQKIPHEEKVASPVAMAVIEAGQDDQMHLVMLLPNGQGLDAVGSYSGVRSRDVAAATINPSQLQAAIAQQSSLVSTGVGSATAEKAKLFKLPTSKSILISAVITPTPASTATIAVSVTDGTGDALTNIAPSEFHLFAASLPSNGRGHDTGFLQRPNAGSNVADRNLAVYMSHTPFTQLKVGSYNLSPGVYSSTLTLTNPLPVPGGFVKNQNWGVYILGVAVSHFEATSNVSYDGQTAVVVDLR